MAIWMWGLILFIIMQRLVELRIAKRNEEWIKRRGGIEVGQKHYKWFVIVHALFFISILLEVAYKETIVQEVNLFLLTTFILAQLGRLWCIHSLGRFWNTKVITLPGVALIKKGPYKYIKHPNYIIVAVELIVIPLLFGAVVTAIIFPILHVILLIIRIPSENKALAKKIVST